MKRLLLILLIALPLFSLGQLVTNNGQSPAALVQNVLLGSGVTVSNITYNGSPVAIGEFDGQNCNIGLDAGVLLTTGTVVNSGQSNGPHGPNNLENSGLDNGTGGYGLLNNIAGIGTFNASILEFDFVPYSDSVRFNYVFASEEYREFVGSEFNDAFGFFISGPGIAGLQNIARVPGSSAEVAINNVNHLTNTAYYNDNGTGNSAPQNGSPFYVQYDGFTDVLTAESEVQCGQTYHLIIAIADAGDPFYDSGIFLEANSLTSNTPITMTHTLSAQVFQDPFTLAEGCVSATVTLDRGTNDLSVPQTVPINISGSATEGVDYTNIPNSVTFAAGQQTIQFSFDAFQDAIVEGQESIIITLPLIDPCGNPQPLELTLYINDVQPVDVEITGDEMDCPGETVTLTANPSGGAPPYTYLWSTGETTQTIQVSPSATTTYSVTVTDDCLGDQATDDFEVVVPVLPPLVLNETPDITEICPYITATIEANPSGGSGNYTYAWSSPGNPNLGTTNSIDVTPSQTTTYTVVVTDNCGNQTTEDVVYTITSPPLTLTMSPTTEICPGDSIQISVTAQGGFGQYFYLWPHSGETTATVWVNPFETTTYEVIVSDECQTFTVEGNTTVEVVKPDADFTITSETVFNNLPIQFQNLSQDAVTYEWDFGDANTSTMVHPQNTYLDPGIYTVTLVAIDDKGCTDTIAKPIEIEEEWYIYVPNTFTPDGNRFNNDFRASTVGIQTLSIYIYNRWGETVFTSNELDFIWDGSYTEGIVQDGTYTYKIEFLTNSERRRTIVGHVNLIR